MQEWGWTGGVGRGLEQRQKGGAMARLAQGTGGGCFGLYYVLI